MCLWVWLVGISGIIRVYNEWWVMVVCYVCRGCCIDSVYYAFWLYVIVCYLGSYLGLYL